MFTIKIDHSRFWILRKLNANEIEWNRRQRNQYQKFYFRVVKKNSIASVIFSYVVGFTNSRGRHSHRFKRNLFTPPVNIPIRLLKARGSRDLDIYHASDSHFRALQIVTHTHTCTVALMSSHCRYVLWRNVIQWPIISCDLSSDTRLGTG